MRLLSFLLADGLPLSSLITQHVLGISSSSSSSSIPFTSAKILQDLIDIASVPIVRSVSNSITSSQLEIIRAHEWRQLYLKDVIEDISNDPEVRATLDVITDFRKEPSPVFQVG